MKAIHIADMCLSFKPPYCIQTNRISDTFFSYFPYNPTGRKDDEIIAIWKLRPKKYMNIINIL